MEAENVVDEIRARLDRGESKEAIYIALIQSGRKVDQVSAAYPRALSKAQPAEVPFKFVNLIFIIAGASAAIGGVSLVATNWRSMNGTGHVLSLVVLSAISYFVGFAIEKKSRFHGVADLLYLVGAGVLGAATFVFAAEVELDQPWPTGVALLTLYISATAWFANRAWLWLVAGATAFVMSIGFIFGAQLVDETNMGGAPIWVFVTAAALLLGSQRLRKQASEMKAEVK